MSAEVLNETQFSTPQATVRVSSGEDGLYVSNLIVGHENRGQGYGTKVMQSINEYADSRHVPVALHARADLHPWYGRLGYSVDPSIPAIGKTPALSRRPR